MKAHSQFAFKVFLGLDHRFGHLHFHVIT